METEAIDLLTNLVAIPSPSGQEQDAVEFLVEWLSRWGFRAYIDEAGNAVGVRGDGHREILLLGHIDTFPGELQVRRQGNLLFGRGTVDAKGSLCAFAAAAKQIPVPADWRITIVGAVEEECATSKGARFVLAERMPLAPPHTGTGRDKERTVAVPGRLAAFSPLGPPAYCIIGEPSHWDRVTLGYKGRLLLEIRLRAPFAHSAGPGRLPAERGVDIWTAVEEYCRDFNSRHAGKGMFDQLTPSLRRFVSRDEGAFGTIDMSLGFRLPLALKPSELEVDLRRVAHRAVFEKEFGGHSDSDTRASLPYPRPVSLDLHCQFSGHEAAYRGSKATPLVRVFLSAIRAAGGHPRFVAKTGTSDMNVVGPYWPQTPILAYGPGDSALDHTPDEHLDVREFSRSIRILRDVLCNLMEG
jgi:LysW-gamma-L-lysine carboxypeptidase